MDMFAVNAGVVNGGALNGSSLPVRTASAAIPATANIAIVGTRVIAAGAQIACTASVSVTPTQIARALADIPGTATVGLAPVTVRAARAEILGTADVLSSVVRIVDATADIACSAELTVVPASTFGSVLIQCTANVIPDATKIQPGYVTAYCAATASAVAVANRMMSALINGVAELRPEPKVNNVYDGYAFIDCTADITMTDVGAVKKISSASIGCSADLALNVSYIHANTKAAIDATAQVIVNPETKVGTGADIAGTASVVAIGTRTMFNGANVAATAEIAVGAVQRHSVSAAINCVANVGVTNILTQSGDVELGGHSDVTAEPTRIRTCEAVVAATANVVVLSTYINHAATADLQGSADIAVSGATTLSGAADVSGTATIYAFPSAVQQATTAVGANAEVEATSFLRQPGDSTIDGTATIYAWPLVEQFAGAMVNGDANIQANARTNADATDPFERTMFRPYVDSLMFRPYVDTDMRRAA